MARYNNSFYRDNGVGIDTSLLQYQGGVGKGLAYLGNSLAQAGQDKIDQQKYDEAIGFRNKQYADTRADRADDVKFRLDESNRNQTNINNDLQFKKDESSRNQTNINNDLQFRKDESNRNQNNIDTQFNFTKQKYYEAEQKQNDLNTAKVNTMREYLSKHNIDTSKYSDKDILYAGDTIEKTHLDNSDYKFSQIVYNDKIPYAMYKDSRGQTKMQPLFDGTNTSGVSQNIIKDREDFYAKKYDDWKNKNYTTTMPIK